MNSFNRTRSTCETIHEKKAIMENTKKIEVINDKYY